MNEILIGNKKIGSNSPCFLIAEIGNNHNLDLKVAKELISISAKCGVDAVKFQTFRGSDIVNSKVSSDEYDGWTAPAKYRSWSEYLDSFSLPFEWYPELIKFTHDKGLLFISTASSYENALFLKKQGAEAIKIASMDLDNLPMLKRISGLELPMIISTGMATLGEISDTAHMVGNSPFALLHAISNYPTLPEDINLNQIKLLLNNFEVPVGFSDHSLEPTSAIGAIAIGARIIEKHLTLDRKMEGPDHFFSTEPAEFQFMVESIRAMETSLGSSTRRLSAGEIRGRLKFRRSIQINKVIEKGKIIKGEDVSILRPGNGIQPRYLSQIVGRVAARDIEPNTQLKWEDLADISDRGSLGDNLSLIPFPEYLFNSQYSLDLNPEKILEAWRNKNGDVSRLERGEAANIFYSLKALPWDTKYFGVKCGVMEEFQLVGEAHGLNVCDVFEESEYDFIICRINSADTKANRVMVNSGCTPVSTKCLFRLKSDSRALQRNMSIDKCILEDCEAIKHSEALISLAKNSLRHGRFFKDRHFNRKASEDVYESWTRRLLESGNSRINVALSTAKQEVIGFAAVTDHELTVNNTGSFEYGFLELIVVDDKWRGIGKALLAGVLSDAAKDRPYLLYANAPADNCSAVSFYYKRGFQCVGTLCEYHWWRKNI